MGAKLHINKRNHYHDHGWVNINNSTDLPYFSFPAIDLVSIIRALCEEFKFRIQPIIIAPFK